MGAIPSIHGSRSLENLSKKPTKIKADGRKNVSKFATIRKKFSRTRSSQKQRRYIKHIRELTQSWNTHQINALVEEYESLAALKELSMQTNLARPRANSLKEDLLLLFERQLFTDVVLEFRNCLFPCHRCILACRSQYFRHLLAKSPEHNACIKVDIQNHQLTVPMFQIMLQYLYSGDVPCIDTSLGNLDILLQLGEEFGTPNILEHDMNELLNSTDFCDVTLVFSHWVVPHHEELPGVESQFEICCHKAILAARSPFFFSLFNKMSKTKDITKPLRLVLNEKVIPRQYGRVLLQCMYLDCVDVSSVIRWVSDIDERSTADDSHKLLTVPEVAMEVYEIARFLDFAALEQGAEDVLIQELSPMSLLATLEWSDQPHGSHWVYRQTLHYLREEFLHLMQLETFLHLPKKFLIETLKSDFLQASEQDILIAVIRWGEAQVYRAMNPTDTKEHFTSSLKRSTKRKDVDVKNLKQVLHGVLSLLRIQHFLPKSSAVLNAAIQQGLLQKEMPLDIGEGERQQRSSWIRVNKDDRKYVKPRLFSAYVEEAKAIMQERMVEEMEVVRLRMIRHSDMPDMVNCINTHHSGTPEAEEGQSCVIGNALPYPDAITVKAMLNREQELKSSNQTQRAYALSLGDGRVVNNEVRKRVVREFGLPDVAVEVLKHAPKEMFDSFSMNQEIQARGSRTTLTSLTLVPDNHIEPDVTVNIQDRKLPKWS